MAGGHIQQVSDEGKAFGARRKGTRRLLRKEAVKYNQGHEDSRGIEESRRVGHVGVGAAVVVHKPGKEGRRSGGGWYVRGGMLPLNSRVYRPKRNRKSLRTGRQNPGGIGAARNLILSYLVCSLREKKRNSAARARAAEHSDALSMATCIRGMFAWGL